MKARVVLIALVLSMSICVSTCNDYSGDRDTPLQRLSESSFSGYIRLKNNFLFSDDPCWSPDGKKIAFVGDWELGDCI